MKSLFEKQNELQIKCFDKMGLGDWQLLTSIPEEKLWNFFYGDENGLQKAKANWVKKHIQALLSEMAELADEYRINHGILSQNGYVELIDILHFLLSLSILVGVSPEEAEVTLDSPIIHHGMEDSLLRMFSCLNRIQNTISWKWWSSEGFFFYDEKIKTEVLLLWFYFWRTCFAFDNTLSLEKIRQIYLQKLEVNKTRLDNGYSIATKDESDNEGIKI